LLTDELCIALEADLDRYYRRDLGDLFNGTLSFRKLVVYLKGLPTDSAIGRLGWWRGKIGMKERLATAQVNEMRLLRAAMIGSEEPPMIDWEV
jgi:hypothetical protein